MAKNFMVISNGLVIGLFVSFVGNKNNKCSCNQVNNTFLELMSLDTEVLKKPLQITSATWIVQLDC